MSRDRHMDFWDHWNQHLLRKDDPIPLLERASDEELVELLGSDAFSHGGYERALVSTEILNRLARRQTDLPSGAVDALRSARGAFTAALKGQRPLHAAERILEASGERRLGRDVSATAATSLDAAKLAFEAAQEHASDVQATQAQTRVSEGLTQDAADAAKLGRTTTEGLETRMAVGGHQKEGKAADDAALDMLDAANVATKLAHRNRLRAEGHPVPETKATPKE